jgi:hypothetical protein
MFSHQGNENQSYIQIPFYSCEKGYHQENKEQQLLPRTGANVCNC